MHARVVMLVLRTFNDEVAKEFILLTSTYLLTDKCEHK
jgi:hypothetical protein